MLEALLLMLGLGGVCGLLLGIAAKAFYVWEDPRIALVEDCMAGANCGGCGYTGCAAAAAAIVSGEAPVSACIVGGATSASKTAAVMGMEAGAAQTLAPAAFQAVKKMVHLPVYPELGNEEVDFLAGAVATAMKT